MTIPATIPQDAQARRVRLLSRLERRMSRMDGTLGRLQRLRQLLRPLLTRLRTGEDPGVVEAELRRMGWKR
ncbi:MAG: hypothetical protein HY323_09310 [Betaproteobacteria bacterium]|nr:hypothetical protein [Betaproteobacteria bacterium]